MEALKRFCSNCGTAMVRQHSVRLSDPFPGSRRDYTKAGLYLCPSCGKIEFYAEEPLKLSDLFSLDEGEPAPED